MKPIFERYRYIIYPNGSEELYDHKSDPFEFENCAGQSEMQAIKDRLKKYRPEWFAKSFGGELGESVECRLWKVEHRALPIFRHSTLHMLKLFLYCLLNLEGFI